jgi:hypothetical protein
MDYYFKKTASKPGTGSSRLNPSYSGGRDQEDCGSKPAWENSLQDPISKKKKSQKRAVDWLKV